jgi:hypothetical protein
MTPTQPQPGAGDADRELQALISECAVKGHFGPFAAGFETMRAENEALRSRAESAEQAVDRAEANEAIWQERMEAAESRLSEAEGLLRVFAAIVPSSLYPADGSEAEQYAVLLKGDWANRGGFTGKDLAALRTFLKKTPTTNHPTDAGAHNG